MIDPVSGSFVIVLPFLPFWVSAEVNTVDHWDYFIVYILTVLYPSCS
jgi:hypothetical protein